MNILALECSATPASAAVLQDGAVRSFQFCNVAQTHSQTLLPMVQNVLDAAGISTDDVDGIAVGNGPGSFTGVRIAIAAVKGLCIAKDLPCVGVSTLLAMAQNFSDQNAVICGVMDARRDQVYNALFKAENGKITRLCEDRALLCKDLADELAQTDFGDLPIYVVGDGCDVFSPFVSHLKNTVVARQMRRYQTAVGVGLAAENDFENRNTVSSKALLPVYLRLPQAERELKAKLTERKS